MGGRPARLSLDLLSTAASEWSSLYLSLGLREPLPFSNYNL